MTSALLGTLRCLRARSLSIRALRNLSAVDVEPGPRFNVLAGDNGQGKTSVLEALYLVATTRSFRTSKLGELTPTHAPATIVSVRATLDEGTSREQSVGLMGGRRSVRLDGERPKGLAEFAARSPVVVFSPSELGISMGPGSERRKLLDRVALYVGARAHVESESYVRAHRERQRALETRGIAGRDLPHWEELMARHAALLMSARQEAAAKLGEAAKHAFLRIATPGLEASFAYAPSAPFAEDAYRQALELSRSRDMARGSASVGPHRDDFLVTLGKDSARHVASQGQHRAIVLALKIAEIEVVSSARGVRPILLLDDVSSELDRARTAALFELLGEQQGQVFLTTTRPDLLVDLRAMDPSTRQDFAIVGGVVAAQAE